ncbi:MAG: 5'/3'-nucleotidase SurE [Bacteroidales bacterium]|nr:5'/3'-nucleotidase SurE [Bacteroidales bacterium]
MEETKPLILITNDDGIFAKGLKELVRAVKDLGEIVVVAPDKAQSGKGHSVTLDMPLWYRPSKIDEEIRAFKCSGTPADCIKIALFKVLDRTPDLILSGINHGSNSSINILYSGTMGAAMEGALHHIPSIGFSLLNFAPDSDFTTAGKYAREITQKVLAMDKTFQKSICLNVNIPYNDPENIKGIKICRQSAGEWKEFFDERYHPSNRRPYYWLTGDYYNYEPQEEDTDEWALKNGYVSVQPVTCDCTDYKMMNELKL